MKPPYTLAILDGVNGHSLIALYLVLTLAKYVLIVLFFYWFIIIPFKPFYAALYIVSTIRLVQYDHCIVRMQ